jgi:signal transduction histidine kinase
VGAGGQPGRNPPTRVEAVHESERTRVSRLFLPRHTVIRKEPLGPDAERRARHETSMLERLRGVAGVAQLAETRTDAESIVLDDAGRASLAQRGGPLAVGDLIGLALELAGAVAGTHRRGVLHRDINPANVVVSDDGAPTLVDFALAGLLAESQSAVTAQTPIVGTLAYLAPEQTGRTGRPVDQRADLYALGATLYQAATGEPPFGSGDPLQLIHDHLARVPVPPAKAGAAIPASLSAIIMHLLEKEPDNRYQSADGVVYDLEQVRTGSRRRDTARLRIGGHDVPPRLPPPARLVGRETEAAALLAAFDGSLEGRCQGVLIGGASGVGKTALADELRPTVTGRDGWFVAGKFDAYRRDLEFDAVNQALRSLGRLLLARPEEELAEIRARIVRGVGPNAGLLAAVAPEFAALLGMPADPGDPLTAQVRAQRASLEVMRAVASRRRPVVLFLDDLQWAGRPALGLVDLLLTLAPVEGLLLVSAYREGDVDSAHPLATPLSRWRARATVRQLRLGNLPASGSGALVAEMLQVDPAAAAALAEVIEPHARGNPYETVELLNALRRDGALTATAAGWQWNEAAVRARLGQSEPAGLLAASAVALPDRSRQVVEAMACLGGRAGLSVLRTATAESPSVLDQMLAPALEEGLLVAEPGADEAVRFRHDRIREVILDGLEPPRRRALQLAMARRLAAVPELFAAAAEQYLPISDAVGSDRERRQVAALLRRAADQATVIGDYALVNALLTAALALIEPVEAAALAQVRTGRHAALYNLGRLEEADEEYRTIEGLCDTAVERAAATAVQVRSLTQRQRLTDAIGLGLETLRELGIAVPAADQVAADLERQFGYLHRWMVAADAPDALTRAELADPALLAAGPLINAIMPATYFTGDQAMSPWLSLEAMRIWLEHGPDRSLVGPASTAAYLETELRGDRSGGYPALQRLLTLGEARGYEPGTSQARLQLAILRCWFEPVENGVREGQRAREGLIAGGDLANATYTYYPATYYLLDCAPTLDRYVAEVEAGLGFGQRTGSDLIGELLESYRWLAGALRGEGTATAGESAGRADSPAARFHAHVSQAIAAAIFGDEPGLARHSAAAAPLLPAIDGQYPMAWLYLLRGLALAGQARAAEGDERSALLAELDEVTRWLAARAADAPDNFLHLLRLVEAERAWAVGDFRAAVIAFDVARHEAGRRQRAWHRALIAERAARFLLAHGVEHSGHDLLARARQEYLAWGATAKVGQLDWAYPIVRPQPDATRGADAGRPADLPQHRAALTTGTVDLLGILSASQALSSETSIERLHARVAAALGAMTGATGVRLLLWDDDRQDWLLPAPASGGAAPGSSAGAPCSGAGAPIGGAGAPGVSAGAPGGGTGDEREAPGSVLRYVKRTREPLVVSDATSDDPFARDPYFADLACCSLAAVPVLSRGSLRAVLLLENRLIRAAFTADRLDAVKLIAGQLAVSLDNAQLYAELTASRARIVATADQTRRRIERDLHDGAQQRLVALVLQLRAARAAVPPALSELAAELEQIEADLAAALDELREIARGIHPAILAEGGLRPALKTLAGRSPIPVDLQLQTDERLPEPVEVNAYYVVAEALTNAARHARASSVRVEVSTTAGVLRVAVQDDGAGGADPTRGTGLTGLRDRVEALGGRIVLASPPGAGTSLRVEFPLATANRLAALPALPRPISMSRTQMR